MNPNEVIRQRSRYFARAVWNGTRYWLTITLSGEICLAVPLSCELDNDLAVVKIDKWLNMLENKTL